MGGKTILTELPFPEIVFNPAPKSYNFNFQFDAFKTTIKTINVFLNWYLVVLFIVCLFYNKAYTTNVTYVINE